MLSPVTSRFAPQVALPAPSSLIPQADGVGDTRVGIAGVTGQFSDAGHIHPITRLVAPAMPPVSVFGDMTATGQGVTQTWTDEESVTFHVYVIGAQPASAGSWGGFNFPNIAGFQPPEWHSVGSYDYSPPYTMENMAVTNWFGTGYANRYVRTTASNKYYLFKVKYTLA